MNRAVRRWLVVAVLAPVAMLPAGCAGQGGFAEQQPPGMDFYEPASAQYGGFNSGFEIGPFQRFDDFGGGRYGGGFGGRGTGFR